MRIRQHGRELTRRKDGLTDVLVEGCEGDPNRGRARFGDEIIEDQPRVPDMASESGKPPR